jgi:DNA-binding response OmpR family regulator
MSAMPETSALRLVNTKSKPTSRATIMVVEDDAVVGRTLATALEFVGYRVRVAATGRAACALQPRIRPDVIILDLMLPDMDGLALTSTLKAVTDAPIIICSARHGEVDRALGFRLGASDFVAKPFDLDDFQARIEALIPGVRNGPGTNRAER